MVNICTPSEVGSTAQLPAVHGLLYWSLSEWLVSCPPQFPDPSLVAEYREPMIDATIVTPDSYLGKVMELAMVGS